MDAKERMKAYKEYSKALEDIHKALVARCNAQDGMDSYPLVGNHIDRTPSHVRAYRRHERAYDKAQLELEKARDRLARFCKKYDINPDTDPLTVRMYFLG